MGIHVNTIAPCLPDTKMLELMETETKKRLKIQL